MGTRGTAEIRAAEAEQAAKTLGVAVRENLGLARRRHRQRSGDAREARAGDSPIAAARRDRAGARGPASRPSRRPRSSFATPASSPASPSSHRICPKHRPLKILHCLTYRQDFVRPTFVVDISDDFELKLEAIRCYASQFEGIQQAGEVYPNGEPLEDVVRHYAAYYGTLIRKRYGEPFFTTEMMAVDDVVVARGIDLLSDDVTYGSYLALDELLSLQRPRSQPEHPDELLFIVVHQASELWFKAILHDLDGLIVALEAREPGPALWRLQRVNALMRIVSAQLSSLETLPPQHFAQFRTYLGTSSGSQSVQFRAIEAASGLRERAFHARARGARDRSSDRPARARASDAPGPLSAAARRQQARSSRTCISGPGPGLLFFLAEALLEYEQQFGQWRFKHVQLVERIIGPQTGGTGGTLGSRYLMRTIDQTFLPEALGGSRPVFRRQEGRPPAP